MKRTREVAFSSNISKTENSLARIVSVEDVLESSETQNLIFPQESEEDKRLKKFMPLLPKKQNSFSSLQDPEKKKRIESLIEISSSLPLVNENEMLRLLEILKQQLKTETDNTINCLIISLLTKLALEISDITPIIEELLNQLQSKSKKIRFQVLQSFQLLSKVKHISNDRVINEILKNIIHLDPKIRSSALLTLSFLCPPNPSSSNDLQTLLSGFLIDNHPMVRRDVLKSLFNLHLNKFPLHVELYNKIVQILKDDFDQVRLEGIKILWILCHLYPDEIVTTSYHDKGVRLINDAFTKICSAVTDPSVSVRALACRLLGSFNNVSSKFLLQTFSREILAGQHRGKLSLGRGKIPYTSTDANNPKGDITITDEVDLLDSGAVGAFISGLEDEFYQVRSATVDSICELSLYSDEFAKYAVDYLVDMFNDEIEEVSINAINSLRKMGNRVHLTEVQLHIVLSSLEDSSQHVRTAVQNLLKVTTLGSIDSVHATIQALLTQFTRYSDESLNNTFDCLKSIGQRHASFIEFLIEDLLRIDPRFMSAEPHVDDIFYISIVLVICNAAQINRNIIPLLPKYIFRHIHYLKDRFPLFFPSPDLFEKDKHQTILRKYDTSEPTIYDTQTFFNQSLNLFLSLGDLLKNKKYDETKRIIQMCSRDLLRITQLDKLINLNADFYLHYLEMLKIIIHIKNNSLVTISNGLCEQLIFQTYEIQQLYLGLDFSTIKDLMELRIFAHALILTLSSQKEETIISKLFSSFSERLNYFQQFCEERELSVNPEISNCIQNIQTNPNTEISSVKLMNLIQQYYPPVREIENLLKKSNAHITSPVSNIDKPIEVSFFVPLQLHIEAQLEFISNINNLCIQCSFLNQTQIFPLTATDFIPKFTFHWNIKKSVTLHQFLITETVCVYVSICSIHSPDSQIDQHFEALFSNVPIPKTVDGLLVPLCKPIPIYLSPRKRISLNLSSRTTEEN